MLFGQDRNQIRQFFFDTWQKRTSGAILQPLEQIIANVIEQHPEYQPLLTTVDAALDRDYLPELGQTNPFLHMGMHIAIHEQLAVERPAGIRDVYRNLSARFGDTHAAEHQMMECLGQVLWQAQRDGTAPDEAAYFECLRSITAA